MPHLTMRLLQQGKRLKETIINELLLYNGILCQLKQITKQNGSFFLRAPSPHRHNLLSSLQGPRNTKWLALLHVSYAASILHAHFHTKP